MNNFQTNPLKLYIQDIFRAERTTDNKYIYQLFGLTFKNVMIHGVVTAMYNKYSNTTNLELSDATGSVQVYYDKTKGNTHVSDMAVRDLTRNFNSTLSHGDKRIPIIRILHKSITDRITEPIDFNEGNYLCVVGDIFVDDIKNIRMLSAFECNVTSVHREIVWLEELKYLYEKYYFENM